tara:strand:+ start:1320 stop:1568 length:249 start_codon:yes stop_codon:yes gene_type:complete
MNRATLKEFTLGFLVMISTPVVIAVLITLLTGCKIQDPIYVSRGGQINVLYENRKGDLIEVPINSDECIGYSKPYHTTSFNK